MQPRFFHDFKYFMNFLPILKKKKCLKFSKKSRGFWRQIYLENFEQNFFFFKMDKKFMEDLESWKKHGCILFFQKI